MNILMISATFPYPPTLGGTQVRTFYLLKHLSQHHAVTLVTQRSNAVNDTDIAALQSWVDHLQVFPRPRAAHLPTGPLGKLSRFGRFLLDATPPHVRYVWTAAMQDWLDTWVRAGKADVITCEHSVNEIFVRPAWRHCVRKTVVDIHSSLYGTCLNQLQTGTAEKPWRDRLSLPLLRRYERQYTAKFTDLVVTTPDDQQQFQIQPEQQALHIIPNGVDLTAFPYRASDPGGHRLIFVGAMDYIANIDTAKFLAQEILPALRQRYPDAEVLLVGARPTQEVKALGRLPGVVVTGAVPSVVEYLHEATVCVVPMRIGYGIKNKTLEAMAAGVPVVASERGLEGLAVDSPQRALRANTPAEYVAAISRLFDNAGLRQELARRARNLIETDYTWDQAGRRYEQVLSS